MDNSVTNGYAIWRSSQQNLGGSPKRSVHRGVQGLGLSHVPFISRRDVQGLPWVRLGFDDRYGLDGVALHGKREMYTVDERSPRTREQISARKHLNAQKKKSQKSLTCTCAYVTKSRSPKGALAGGRTTLHISPLLEGMKGKLHRRPKRPWQGRWKKTKT